MRGGSQSSFVLLGIGFIGVAPSGLDYTCKNQQRKVMLETWNAISKRANSLSFLTFDWQLGASSGDSCAQKVNILPWAEVSVLLFVTWS